MWLDLAPQRAVCSDVNPSLMTFYRAVAGAEDLAPALRGLARAWSGLGPAGARATPTVLAQHDALAGLTRERVRALAADACAAAADDLARVAAACRLLEHGPFLARVARTLDAKLWRIRNAEAAGRWSDADLAAQVETALRAGLYTYLRDDCTPVEDIDVATRFFFLREFCYGSMFRLNRHGHFNIPYGGRSYNTKDLAAKVEHLCSQEVRDLLGRTQLHTRTFSESFADVGRDDVVFLDPPYDSAFSEYDGFAFGAQEQAALAEAVRACPGRVLAVVQRTPRVEALYRGSCARGVLRVESYTKRYSYNTKGRNDRDAEHLVIRNY